MEQTTQTHLQDKHMLDCIAQLSWIRHTTRHKTNLQREEIKTVALSGPVFSSPKPQLTQKSQI